jgi:hypothetical protein
MLKAAVFSALAAALIGLICGWYSWRSAARDQALPAWRRITSSLGLFAMSAQAWLLVAIYTDLWSRYPVWFDRWWFRSESILFFLAAPLFATEKSTSKWWLFASSAYLLVFCFLVMLDA